MDIAVFGQHFIVGLSGSRLLPEERKLLKQLRPLGIILFAKNMVQDAPDWQRLLSKLITDVKRELERDQVLISIDHEGGRVYRFPDTDTVTHFGYARQWRDNARAVGETMGRELANLGINLNFAPVVDVDSEPENPVIGERAFSPSPREVAFYAKEFIQGMHSQGVLGCLKHFPGHGATKKDSHFELPVLPETMEVLWERELLPYRELFQDKYPPLVMSAHVNYPEIDPHYPATLSSIILRDLLREKLGFRGAVISDDMFMGALQQISLEERTLGAIQAGVDIFLEGNPTEDTLPLAEAVKKAEILHHALAQGKLTGEIFEQSQGYIGTVTSYPLS